MLNSAVGNRNKQARKNFNFSVIIKQHVQNVYLMLQRKKR